MTRDIKEAGSKRGAFLSKFIVCATLFIALGNIVYDRYYIPYTWEELGRKNATEKKQRMLHEKSNSQEVMARYLNRTDLMQKVLQADELLDYMSIYGNSEKSQNARSAAKMILEQAYIENPTYIPLLMSIARLYLSGETLDQGDFTVVTEKNSQLYSAEKVLNSGIKLEPDYADLYALRAFVYASMRRDDQAKYDIDTAKKKGSNYRWLLSNEAFISFQKENYNHAGKLYQDVVEEGPGDSLSQYSVYFSAIDKLQHIAYMESNLTRLKELAEIGSQHWRDDDAYARFNAGNKLCREGAFVEGEKFLLESIKLINSCSARYALSVCLYGRWAEAVDREFTTVSEKEATELLQQALTTWPNIYEVAKSFKGSGEKLKKLAPILEKKGADLLDRPITPEKAPIVGA